MQITIDAGDWQRLSPSARQELLKLVGVDIEPAATSTASPKGFRWRVPYDLTPALVRKLLRGLSDDAVKRIRLFTKRNGRVTMQELLAVTKDSDLHVLSAFEGIVTRKLRRLVGDDNKIVSFMMWDYDSEKWDKDHTELKDGVFYVSDATARTLQQHFSRG
jgi:hypothetical protein